MVFLDAAGNKKLSKLLAKYFDRPTSVSSAFQEIMSSSTRQLLSSEHSYVLFTKKYNSA